MVGDHLTICESFSMTRQTQSAHKYKASAESPHFLMLYIWVYSPTFPQGSICPFLLSYIDCSISNCAFLTFPVKKGFLLNLHLHYNYTVFSLSAIYLAFKKKVEWYNAT